MGEDVPGDTMYSNSGSQEGVEEVRSAGKTAEAAGDQGGC